MKCICRLFAWHPDCPVHPPTETERDDEDLTDRYSDVDLNCGERRAEARRTRVDVGGLFSGIGGGKE